MDHYLVVKEWVPNFNPRNTKTDKLLVWVRFPALPIEYFDDDFLKKIGKEIGRPIKIDTTTSLVSKGRFARVCVEVDLTNPLLSKFTVGDMVVPIEYEGIHMVCFSCGIYGHKQGQCAKEGTYGNKATETRGADLQGNNSRTDKMSFESRSPKTAEHDFKNNFGAWMLVTRRDRRGQRRGGSMQGAGYRGPGIRQATPRNADTGHLETSSRFAMLDGLEEENEAGLLEEPAEFPIDNQITKVSLPSIRTNQNPQKTTEVQRTRERKLRVNFQQNEDRQTQTAVRGAARGRGGRGKAPRQAAESEHTVVRDSNRGKHITSSVVYHFNDDPGPSHANEFGYAYNDDPSDIARVFTNPPEPPDEAMSDAMRMNGQIGPDADCIMRD